MLMKNFEIEFLRACAIICVIYFHWGNIFLPSCVSSNELFGTIILDVTFAISGFVISNLIIKTLDHAKSDKKQLAFCLKHFYIRRFLRIYPAAWAVFLFVLLCCIFFNNSQCFMTIRATLEAGMYIFTYIFNYFYLNVTTFNGVNHLHLNYGLALTPYWTLSIEEVFYIFYPLFIIFTNNNRQRVVILLSILVLDIFIIRPLTLQQFPIVGVFYTQTRLDGFIYGCLIYFIAQQKWFEAIRKLPSNNQYINFLLLVFLFVLMDILNIGNFSENIIFIFGDLLAFLLLLLAVLERKIFVLPRLLQACLEKIGQRSYSLYLVHTPMLMFAREIWYRVADYNNTYIGEFAILSLWLMAVGTELIYRFIETPLRKKRRQLAVSQKTSDLLVMPRPAKSLFL